jgi:hypothetical protein
MTHTPGFMPSIHLRRGGQMCEATPEKKTTHHKATNQRRQILGACRAFRIDFHLLAYDFT